MQLNVVQRAYKKTKRVLLESLFVGDHAFFYGSEKLRNDLQFV